MEPNALLNILQLILNIPQIILKLVIPKPHLRVASNKLIFVQSQNLLEITIDPMLEIEPNSDGDPDDLKGVGDGLHDIPAEPLDLKNCVVEEQHLGEAQGDQEVQVEEDSLLCLVFDGLDLLFEGSERLLEVELFELELLDEDSFRL